jgi:hypothetical protein
MRSLSADLSLGAQTSYAELYNLTQSVERVRFATMRGSFRRRIIKNKTYVYFNFRDTDGQVRSAYVGPDSERVQRLISEFEQDQVADRLAALAQRSRACMALGCTSVLDKHCRVIRKLASYGLFRVGGVLIGIHAFVAVANMLGIRWTSGKDTASVGLAHDGRAISVALPADLELSRSDAITSLEAGLLPIQEFSGKTAAQDRNPHNPELSIRLVAPGVRLGEGKLAPGLGIEPAPEKFTEFLLEGTAQGVVLAKSGACLVNLPDPARIAIYNIIVYGERTRTEQAESSEGLVQAEALIEWHLDQGRGALIREAWLNASVRGIVWRRSANEGRDAFLVRHPALAGCF